MPADLNDALSAGLNPDPGGTRDGEASAALTPGTLFTTVTLCHH